jgi:glycopeptide antibiotics resistance protein
MVEVAGAIESEGQTETWGTGEHGTLAGNRARPALGRPLRRFSALLAWVVVGLVVAWLLSMTLRPGGAVNHVHLVPFSEKWAAVTCLTTAGCSWQRNARYDLVIDTLGNLLVFVPFGAALAVATLRDGRPGKRWWLTILAAGFALSLGIELAQWAVPGRVTDIDDLILNVTGTLFGAAGIRFLDLVLQTVRLRGNET